MIETKVEKLGLQEYPEFACVYMPGRWKLGKRNIVQLRIWRDGRHCMHRVRRTGKNPSSPIVTNSTY